MPGNAGVRYLEASEPIGSYVTADDLLGISPPGRQVELIRGELVVREPPNAWHGAIANRLAYLLASFVEEAACGAVFGHDTGFQIASDPDTVRAPDVAFVRRERLSEIPRRAYPRLAPDLAVEVISPGERPGELLAKVADWLEAGTSVAWVLDPESCRVRVHAADGSLEILGPEDDLTGGDLLPGFRCSVAEVVEPGW